MPKELKALLSRGRKVRDRLGRLSDQAAKLSAEADKVLVRPDSSLSEDLHVLAVPPSQEAHDVEPVIENRSLPGGRGSPHPEES